MAICARMYDLRGELILSWRLRVSANVQSLLGWLYIAEKGVVNDTRKKIPHVSSITLLA